MNGFSIATRLFFIMCVLITLSGCATQKAVTEQGRDQTGKFDGVWVVSVEGRGGKQSAGSTNLNCRARKWKSTIVIRNAKGTANLRFGATLVPFYVNEEGSFFASRKTKATWSSNKPIVVNLAGILEENKGKGVYTVTAEEFYGAGCRHGATFTRSGS